MKKGIVKVAAILLTGLIMAAGFTGCSKEKGDSASEQSRAKHRIGIGLYEDSGPQVTAVKAFLESIKDELNLDYVYVTLSMTDEAVNKTRAQEMISAGCEGIILTMDSATEAIMSEAQKAKVYVAGYLNDYDVSYESIKSHPNFVGTVVDGRYLGHGWGKEVADRVIVAGHKNIGLIKFPVWAFPHQEEMDQSFRGTIAKFNETASDADKIVLQDTEELMFQPLASTYFEAHPDVDAIFGMVNGAEFIYPVQVATGRTDVKLYTAGFNPSNDILDNFGTAGTGTIQELVYSNVEAIVYPLVMLLNKIDGVDFEDQPAEADRVDSSQIIITSDEKLDIVREKSLYYTGDAADAFLDGKDVLALLASEGGTYKGLVKTVQTMSVEDLAVVLK